MKKDSAIKISVILTLIVYLVIFYPNYSYLTDNTVKLLAIASSYFVGVTPVYYQNNIFVNFGTITPIIVSPECSAIIAMAVFLIVVCLVPNVSLKSRVYAFTLVPIIYFTNLFRLLLGIVIGNKFGVNSMILYHATVGQVFTFIVLVTCFIIFVRFNKHHDIASHKTEKSKGLVF
jgi:exosortase/archaeosortase family protein